MKQIWAPIVAVNLYENFFAGVVEWAKICVSFKRERKVLSQELAISSTSWWRLERCSKFEKREEKKVWESERETNVELEWHCWGSTKGRLKV